jgi:hypothetical protein
MMPLKRLSHANLAEVKAKWKLASPPGPACSMKRLPLLRRGAALLRRISRAFSRRDLWSFRSAGTRPAEDPRLHENHPRQEEKVSTLGVERFAASARGKPAAR